MRELSQQIPRAKTHLVVGDGITALAFVENLTLLAGDSLTVLGQQASQLGRGAAYAKGVAGTPWRYAYLLNSPADDIDPAFAAWLADRWETVRVTMRARAPDWLSAAAPLVNAGDIYGVNAPREFYGDFMCEQAERRFANLRAQGVHINLVDDQATTLEVAGDDVIVTTAKGQRITAAEVDICPGGPSTLRIEGDDGPFAVPTVFGNEDRIAAHIKAGAEIFCIGGNAAMLDVLRLCESVIPKSDLRFAVCAPDGEIPPPLIPRLPRKLTKPKLTEGHKTAKAFLAEVEREIARAKLAGDEMREIRAGFRAHFLANPLHHYVSEPDEARLVPTQLRFWLRGGTRDTILDMQELVADGTVRLMHGFVKGVSHHDNGATVTIGMPDGDEMKHKTGFVVNCAGAGPNSRYDPLTEHLLKKGLIATCPISRGLKVGARCRTNQPNIRYLSPAVTEIGDEVMAMPLYDAHMLRTYARQAVLPI